MKFMLSPKVMERIMKTLLWRRIIEEISRNHVKTRYDAHYFAVSIFGPFSDGTQPVSLRSIAKILGCSLADAHSYIAKHTESVLSRGICGVCNRASSKLKTKLRNEQVKALSKDWLVAWAWKLY